MKKVFFLTLALIMLLSQNVYASTNNTQSTSYTYSKSIYGYMDIAQDAYLPTELMLDLNLNEAQDMFLLNDIIYIADTKNKRALKVDLLTGDVLEFGSDVFSEPKGISADSQGRIYVADIGTKEAYRFSAEGVLEKTFEKPTSPNFGNKESYFPSKLAPTDDGGIYLISEGTNAGIVHINGNGEFLGFFASNNVQLTTAQKIMDAVLTDAQKEMFMKVRPSSYSQIYRGTDGLIYTLNKGDKVHVKKHSISGLDLLAKSAASAHYTSDVTDICVSEDGRIFVVQFDGVIAELNNEGLLISAFGENTEGTERIGLFEAPSGIGVDSKGNLYVLDSARNYIQVFKPTENQKNIYKAINLYNDGKYNESKEILADVLKFNNTSYLAQYYTGKCYLQLGEYEKAADHFKICESRGEYSLAYWEIRNQWLQQNLGIVMLIIIILFVIFTILAQINKRKDIYRPLRNLKTQVLQNRICKDLSLMKYAIYHPIDNAYNVKVGITGTYASGFIVYALLFIVFTLVRIASGFIFSVPLENYNVFSDIVYFVGVLGLFIIANYYVTSINDGNGKFKDVFLCVAYSFSPVILFMPFVIIFANFATTNEFFLIQFAMGFLLTLSIINLFVSLIEIHEYSFSENVKSILITAFVMIIVILAGTIIYMLPKQIIDFVREIITEVMLRV